MSGATALFGMRTRSDPAVLSAAWSDISITFPTTSGTNEDRDITWAIGGNRNVSITSSTIGFFDYRIEAGSWVPYVSPFSHVSGQSVGWRYTGGGDEASVVASVFVDGELLDQFTTTATGFPP